MDWASATPQGWNFLCLRGSIIVDCFEGQPWRGVAGLVRYINLYHGPDSFWTEAGRVNFSRGCLIWAPRSTGFCRDPRFFLKFMDAGASWTALLLRHGDGLPCVCVVVSWLIVFPVIRVCVTDTIRLRSTQLVKGPN